MNSRLGEATKKSINDPRYNGKREATSTAFPIEKGRRINGQGCVQKLDAGTNDFARQQSRERKVDA